MPTDDRALILANRLPYPLDDGWKVRTFHVVREVARRMPVTLVVFDDAGEQARRLEFVERLDGRVEVVTLPPPRPYTPARLLLGLISRWPIQYWNNRDRGFQDAVDRVVREQRPAVAMAVCAFMFPYLEPHPSIPLRIIDTHNVDSDLMRRYLPHVAGAARRAYARLTVRKLEALEARTFPRADQVWVCSDDEADLLARRDPETPVRVIPNGVDTDHFADDARPITARRLLFFGKLNYFPNSDALDYLIGEILPRLEDVPLQVAVVGVGASEEIANLCARAPRVELVGRVDDVREWLSSAELVIVPLRMGSGTRLKVLEAMAAGRPVLSTSIGAEGIIAEPGREILTADTPEAFAGEIARVLADRQFGEQIGRAGQEAVRRRYDWRAIGERMEKELAAASPAAVSHHAVDHAAE